MTIQIRINLSDEQMKGLDEALGDCGFQAKLQRVPADATVDPMAHSLATVIDCKPDQEQMLTRFIWTYCRGFKDGVWACMDEAEDLPRRLESIGEVTLPGKVQIEYSAPQMPWETTEAYAKRMAPPLEKPQLLPDPEPATQKDTPP